LSDERLRELLEVQAYFGLPSPALVEKDSGRAIEPENRETWGGEHKVNLGQLFRWQMAT
jgi:hypothetical protein